MAEAKHPQPSPPHLKKVKSLDAVNDRLEQIEEYLRKLAAFNELTERMDQSTPNYIGFKNTAGETRGVVYLNAAETPPRMALKATGGAELWLVAESSNDVVVASSTALRPQNDNATSCGTATKRWSLVRGVVITPGDIEFENKWRITEPHHVWNDADPDDGLVFLMPDSNEQGWAPIAWLRKDGKWESNLKPAHKRKRIPPHEQEAQEQDKE